MTIYYLDPEGGDDTKSGTSFANRWKTLKNTQTTPPVAGDEYRMVASKAPYSLGSAVWTDNQGFVELANANILNITTEATGWVPKNSTDIYTSNSDITESLTMLGPKTIFYNSNPNYSGKMAHKVLAAPLNLSAWTHLSFILNSDESQPLQLKINLCSDLTGDVPLASFTLPVTRSYKFPALVTNGGPLPNGVRSISIHTAVPIERSVGLVGIENVIACTGPGQPDHLSHSVIISKMSEGQPEFLPVRGIVGKKVYIGPYRIQNTSAPFHRPWRGITGPAECFAIQPIKLRWLKRYESLLNNYTLSIDFTGGWDRGDMATRNGVTWLHGENMRVLSGYPGASNPDSWSGADPYQMLIMGEQSAQDAQIQETFKLHGFGFTDFREFPVEHNPYHIRDYDIEGMVGIGYGMPAQGIGNNSKIKIGYVSHCWYGLFTNQNRRLFTAVSDKENFQLNVGRITGCWGDLNWLPSSDFTEESSRLYVGAIENAAGGLTTGYSKTSDPQRVYSQGVFRLHGTKFRYLDSWDVIAVNEAVLYDCQFLNDDGTPGRVPSFQAPSGTGASLKMYRTDGNGWDTRVFRTSKQDWWVENTGGRSPGKNVVTLKCAKDFFDKRITPPAVAQIALVAARAGVVTTVAAYIQQDQAIEPNPPYYAGQRAYICTAAGLTPGVEYVEGVCMAKPRRWNKVVIAFTSEVDALVPIFLGGTTGVVKATEVMMVPEGTEPEGVPPIIPPGPPVLTDSFTFKGVLENVAGVYSAWPAGSASSSAFMAQVGIPMENFSQGTVFESVGYIDGASILTDGADTYLLLVIFKDGWKTPGWSGDSPMKLWQPVILDENGEELWRQTAFYAAQGSDGSGAYANWVMGQWVIPAGLVDGSQKLTVQIWRVDRGE